MCIRKIYIITSIIIGAASQWDKIGYPHLQLSRPRPILYPPSTIKGQLILAPTVKYIPPGLYRPKPKLFAVNTAGLREFAVGNNLGLYGSPFRGHFSVPTSQDRAKQHALASLGLATRVVSTSATAEDKRTTKLEDLRVPNVSKISNNFSEVGLNGNGIEDSTKSQSTGNYPFTNFLPAVVMTQEFRKRASKRPKQLPTPPGFDSHIAIPYSRVTLPEHEAVNFQGQWTKSPFVFRKTQLGKGVSLKPFVRVRDRFLPVLDASYAEKHGYLKRYNYIDGTDFRHLPEYGIAQEFKPTGKLRFRLFNYPQHRYFRVNFKPDELIYLPKVKPQPPLFRYDLKTIDIISKLSPGSSKFHGQVGLFSPWSFTALRPNLQQTPLFKKVSEFDPSRYDLPYKESDKWKKFLDWPLHLKSNNQSFDETAKDHSTRNQTECPFVKGYCNISNLLSNDGLSLTKESDRVKLSNQIANGVVQYIATEARDRDNKSLKPNSDINHNGGFLPEPVGKYDFHNQQNLTKLRNESTSSTSSKETPSAAVENGSKPLSKVSTEDHSNTWRMPQNNIFDTHLPEIDRKYRFQNANAITDVNTHGMRNKQAKLSGLENSYVEDLLPDLVQQTQFHNTSTVSKGNDIFLPELERKYVYNKTSKIGVKSPKDVTTKNSTGADKNKQTQIDPKLIKNVLASLLVNHIKNPDQDLEKTSHLKNKSSPETQLERVLRPVSISLLLQPPEREIDQKFHHPSDRNKTDVWKETNASLISNDLPSKQSLPLIKSSTKFAPSNGFLLSKNSSVPLHRMLPPVSISLLLQVPDENRRHSFNPNFIQGKIINPKLVKIALTAVTKNSTSTKFTISYPNSSVESSIPVATTPSHQFNSTHLITTHSSHLQVPSGIRIVKFRPTSSNGVENQATFATPHLTEKNKQTQIDRKLIKNVLASLLVNHTKKSDMEKTSPVKNTSSPETQLARVLRPVSILLLLQPPEREIDQKFHSPRNKTDVWKETNASLISNPLPSKQSPPLIKSSTKFTSSNDFLLSKNSSVPLHLMLPPVSISLLLQVPDENRRHSFNPNSIQGQVINPKLVKIALTAVTKNSTSTKFTISYPNSSVESSIPVATTPSHQFNSTHLITTHSSHLQVPSGIRIVKFRPTSSNGVENRAKFATPHLAVKHRGIFLNADGVQNMRLGYTSGKSNLTESIKTVPKNIVPFNSSIDSTKSFGTKSFLSRRNGSIPSSTRNNHKYFKFKVEEADRSDIPVPLEETVPIRKFNFTSPSLSNTTLQHRSNLAKISSNRGNFTGGYTRIRMPPFFTRRISSTTTTMKPMKSLDEIFNRGKDEVQRTLNHTYFLPLHDEQKVLVKVWKKPLTPRRNKGNLVVEKLRAFN